MLALCRYVDRNPVAAGLVGNAGDLPWSSYPAHAGQAESPRWLDSAGLYAHLLGRPADTPAAARQAAAQYAAMVATVDEARSPSIWTDGLRQQTYLCNDDFVARMQARLSPERSGIAGNPCGAARGPDRTAPTQVVSGLLGRVRHPQSGAGDGLPRRRHDDAGVGNCDRLVGVACQPSDGGVRKD